VSRNTAIRRLILLCLRSRPEWFATRDLAEETGYPIRLVSKALDGWRHPAVEFASVQPRAARKLRVRPENRAAVRLSLGASDVLRIAGMESRPQPQSSLTDGDIEALRVMGGDLSVMEWAAEFGVPERDVIAVLVWLARERAIAAAAVEQLRQPLEAA
jgi:hypothetical protein